MDTRYGYVLRFLPTGKVKHYLRDSRSNVSECGVWTFCASQWYGTGSQDEIETLEKLPLCKRCEKHVK